MEARIARLESDVSHLRTDVADIKIDLRSLRDKIEAMFTKLSEKIEGVEQRLNARFDSTTRWALALYVALAAAMLGAMGRGFGWI